MKVQETVFVIQQIKHKCLKASLVTTGNFSGPLRNHAFRLDLCNFHL